MENTRVKLLDDIDDWSRDPDVARIFWLDGMAGTGKSAIARSVCHMLREAGLLAGSFFCSRGIREDVGCIIPTISMSLARRNASYRAALVDVLSSNPDIGHYTVELQIEHLLEKPLGAAFLTKRPTLVFVVDALDECSNPGATKAMLSAIVSCSPRTPIKFFLTSRPEHHIRTQFISARHDRYHMLRLYDIEKDIVEADIRHYCRRRLQKIRITREEQNPSHAFPLEWPSDRDIEYVTLKAGKLFIYAFTAISYIEESPVQRLLGLANSQNTAERPLTEPLDEMYGKVLTSALDSKLRTQDEIKTTRRLLAIILMLRESLSVKALSELIGISTQDIRTMLERLHAVVYTPVENDSGTIATFHASFEDYLTSPARAPEAFRIDHSDGHEALANACIRVMASDMLHFNVSGFCTSYLSNLQQIFAPIPTWLVYSCLHWVHHFIRIRDPSPLLSSIYSILQRKTLFWIEVLSASGNVRLAVGLLMGDCRCKRNASICIKIL